MNKSNKDRPTLDVGADLFISNLAPDVTEDMIKTTFSQFGQLACEPIVPLLFLRNRLMCRLLVIRRRTSARATPS